MNIVNGALKDTPALAHSDQSWPEIISEHTNSPPIDANPYIFVHVYVCREDMSITLIQLSEVQANQTNKGTPIQTDSVGLVLAIESRPPNNCLPLYPNCAHK